MPLPVRTPALLIMALTAALATPGTAQDTVRVRSVAPPVWGTDIRLTPRYTLGGDAAPMEASFASVEAMAVDRRGRVYIADGQTTQIRAYDANGKFLHPVGRKGAGPGEYNMVGGMEILQDSILVVFDPGNTRLTLFLPNGKLLRSIREPRASNYGDRSIFAIDRNNLIYLRVRRAAGNSRSGEVMAEHEAGTGGPSHSIYLRYRPDGTLQDSLSLPPSIPTTRPFYLMTADGGTSNFIPETWIAPHTAGGLIFGNGDALRVVIKPPSGPVRVVDRAWKPVELMPEERSQWEAWATYFAEQDRSNARYTIPKTKPAFRDLFSDRDGRIWVSVYAEAEKINRPPRAAGDKRPLLTWNQRATYEVFDPTGVYLGRVMLPARSQLLTAQGNQLWILAKGADDEALVKMFTIERQAGSG